MIEYYGERNNVTTGLYGSYKHPIDSWNNTYTCIRMINGAQNRVNGTIYCKFKCYDMISHIQVECPDKTVPQYYGSFYDLDNDYYQLANGMLNLSKSNNETYMNFIDAFLSCKGQTECNALRQGSNY